LGEEDRPSGGEGDGMLGALAAGEPGQGGGAPARGLRGRQQN